MLPQRLAGYLAGASILVVTGCGGGGGGGSTPPPPPFLNLTTFQPASVVVGQPTFVVNLANQGGSAAANTVSYPHGNAALVSGVLYLPDRYNNRVLGFNGVPTANDANADFVLGQPDVTNTISGPAEDEMSEPRTVATHGGKLLVADTGNSRVLIWNTIPTTNGAPADVVVGQENFGFSTVACERTRMNTPESIAVAGGRLLVADTGNNRVLVWNTIPTTNGAPADLVLGQGLFDICQPNDIDHDGDSDIGPHAGTLSEPAGVWSDGTRVVVADAGNNRVLIWTSFPTSNFAPADLVLGQQDFENAAANDDDQDGAGDADPSARTFQSPRALASNGTQIFVADENNNRVLVWNAFPAINFAPADVVLGQQTFALDARNDRNGDGTADTPSARTLSSPTGVYVSGTQLFVADAVNHRWLVYDGQ